MADTLEMKNNKRKRTDDHRARPLKAPKRRRVDDARAAVLEAVKARDGLPEAWDAVEEAKALVQRLEDDARAADANARRKLRRALRHVGGEHVDVVAEVIIGAHRIPRDEDDGATLLEICGVPTIWAPTDGKSRKKFARCMDLMRAEFRDLTFPVLVAGLKASPHYVDAAAEWLWAIVDAEPRFFDKMKPSTAHVFACVYEEYFGDCAFSGGSSSSSSRDESEDEDDA